ncbi:hypothetical protein CN325_22075 [Bacillus thuringiensis]|uniref:hypothetical protein n=1 Tax=Bacillus thuringiensis TaxID=1428 RepID=UPI000BFA6109|nr:hypothetical protein [Bacillus thuringiensis]PFE92767.1 hypothetical protein CN325_22075 [Bacillus thuringiensis]
MAIPLPEEKFQKYVVLWGYLIPHGVFNQPNKWVNTYTISPSDTYVLVTEFNPKEYEYMIYEETRVARQLHQILEPYGIDINNEFEEFVKLEEIPKAAISKVKDCLIEKKCMNDYPEDFPVVDGYEYIIKGEKKKLIIVTETYRKTVTNGFIYVFKTHDNNWYQYYAEDASKDCWIMKEIYDDELDDLPITSYELIETEKREIAEENLKANISWEELLDPNRECDFYYSDKMFAMSFLANEGRYNVVNIDGEWKIYSEMVFKGEAPFSKWDDLEYIGTAKQGATEGKQFTQKEMMQFAVYMREKREKSSLH